MGTWTFAAIVLSSPEENLSTYRTAFRIKEALTVQQCSQMHSNQSENPLPDWTMRLVILNSEARLLAQYWTISSLGRMLGEVSFVDGSHG